MVNLLVPELQKRGIYWDEYAKPGGTARENLHNKPGEPLLAPEHPGAKLRWNAASPVATVGPQCNGSLEESKGSQDKQVNGIHTPVAVTEVAA